MGLWHVSHLAMEPVVMGWGGRGRTFQQHESHRNKENTQIHQTTFKHGPIQGCIDVFCPRLKLLWGFASSQRSWFQNYSNANVCNSRLKQTRVLLSGSLYQMRYVSRKEFPYIPVMVSRLSDLIWIQLYRFRGWLFFISAVSLYLSNPYDWLILFFVLHSRWHHGGARYQLAIISLCGATMALTARVDLTCRDNLWPLGFGSWVLCRRRSFFIFIASFKSPISPFDWSSLCVN